MSKPHEIRDIRDAGVAPEAQDPAAAQASYEERMGGLDLDSLFIETHDGSYAPAREHLMDRKEQEDDNE